MTNTTEAVIPATKILIVDDSFLVGAKVAELLLSIPDIVLLPQVGTEEEAIKSCIENSPDIVLVDFHLSNGNGMEVVKAIKNNQAQTKIIMLTNSSNEFYIKKFKEFGGDIFLDKTKDFSEIVSVVAAFIQPIV